jgi:hypothetical protein
MALEQQLATPRKSAALPESLRASAGVFFRAMLANLVTSESKCRRITVRPWHGRYSPSGDSI